MRQKAIKINKDKEQKEMISGVQQQMQAVRMSLNELMPDGNHVNDNVYPIISG